MRIILNLIILLLAFSATLSAQNDFASFDRQSYDYYIKGDYKNLKTITSNIARATPRITKRVRIFPAGSNAAPHKTTIVLTAVAIRHMQIIELKAIR